MQKNKKHFSVKIFSFKTNIIALRNLLKDSKCFSFVYIFKTLIYIYAVALIVLGYLNSKLIYNLLLFLVVNAILSSILIVCSSLNKGEIIVLSTLLFLLYLVSFSSANKSNLKVPCNPLEVIAAEGTVLNDVNITQNGNFIIKIKCLKVSLRSDLDISFDGEIRILSKENYNLTRSSFISCDLHYDEELNLYKGENIKVYSLPKTFSFDSENINYRCQNDLWMIRVLRVKYRNWIYRNIKPTLGRLLLLGQSDDDGFIFKESALNVGCSHLLALSGMHLSYISTFFSFIPVFILRKRKKSYLLGKKISLIFPFVFVFIAGALPSLIRALLMYTLSIIIKESEFKREFIFIVSLVIQLFIFKFSITEIGLLLSYTIIASLSILNLNIQKKGWLKGSILSTLVALVVSYPLGKLFGGTWSIAALAVAPISTIIISISMILSLILFLNLLGINILSIIFANIVNEGVIYGTLKLFYGLVNFFIIFLENRINYFESLLKYVFKKGIRFHLYIPIIYSGAKGYEVYCLTLLTVLLVYLYSIAIIRYRRKRIYELELSIRFPKCNHTNP